MNDTQKLAAALDRAINPHDDIGTAGMTGPERADVAARRKKLADKKAAYEAKLNATLSPGHKFYSAMEKKFSLAIPETLFQDLENLRGQHIAASEMMLAHTHTRVNSAYQKHLAELGELAAQGPEAINSIVVRTKEEFESDFLFKLKAANKQCQIIRGKIYAIINPIRRELADDIERLAEQIDNKDWIEADELGLEHEPSHTVMQMRKSVHDLRNSVIELNLTADAMGSVADFCAKSETDKNNQ